MAVAQFPNRIVSLQRGAAPASIVANQQQVLGNITPGKARTPASRFAQSLASATPTGRNPQVTKNATRPTITGWQNYTGRTMGPVGQYSRVPGFGRSFRG